MSTPIKVSRATTKGVRPAPLRSRLPGEDPSIRPKQATPWKKHVSSFSVSMTVHAVLLFILSLIYFDLPNHPVIESFFSLIQSGHEPAGGSLEIHPAEMIDTKLDFGAAAEMDVAMALQVEVLPPTQLFIDAETIPASEGTRGLKVGTGPKPGTVKVATASKSATKGKAETKRGAEAAAATEAVPHMDQFVGRTPGAKRALLKRMGGSDESEAAVARGLVWLKNHQLLDGSWNFYHLLNPRCDCTMPGIMVNNPNASTAMALLAFLGAGQTHQAGDYQQEVQRGLDFLIANGIKQKKGICFYGTLSGPPTFYTHGLVTIALSEAFAMTADPDLHPQISGAIEFLAATQDSAGGWRYYPGQPGDTSVVAWQLMALKSAQFSRITIPPKVFPGIERFLRSVGSMRGSKYAYMPDRVDNPTFSMTAAGLLCRMYMDWKEDNGGIQAGVRLLDEHGPEPEGMYYNYYATQVMHHWGGPEWDRWNNVMREHLIKTQLREGHATGSWDPADRHGNVGGRLYMTTLALLTLEVYYRHLPLYQKERIEIPLMDKAAAAKNP